MVVTSKLGAFGKLFITSSKCLPEAASFKEAQANLCSHPFSSLMDVEPDDVGGADADTDMLDKSPDHPGRAAEAGEEGADVAVKGEAEGKGPAHPQPEPKEHPDCLQEQKQIHGFCQWGAARNHKVSIVRLPCCPTVCQP